MCFLDHCILFLSSYFILRNGIDSAVVSVYNAWFWFVWLVTCIVLLLTW
nr:MAG TPA: WW domain-binding protein 1 [Caudoviricetes sp.]